MRYFFSLFIMMLISCTTNNNNLSIENDYTRQYKKKLNENGTYIIYYKINNLENSSIKNISFFVTDKKNKIVRKEETITAEKIDWKDNNTISVIPYVGIIEKEEEISDTLKSNEKLITIQ